MDDINNVEEERKPKNKYQKTLYLGRKANRWMWWLGYIYYNYQKGILKENIELVENFEFDSIMRFDSFVRGASSAKAVLFDKNNVRYEVFLGDFGKMVPLMTNGFIEGTFTFCKKGQNFGIKLVEKSQITTEEEEE